MNLLKSIYIRQTHFKSFREFFDFHREYFQCLGLSMLVYLTVYTGTFLYQVSQQVTPWKLIPSNAVLAVEVNEPKLLQQASLKDWVASLQKEFPWPDLQQQQWRFLRQVVADFPSLQFVAMKQPLMASLHPTAKKKYEALWFLPLDLHGRSAFFAFSVGLIKQSPKYRLTQRMYHAMKIWELKKKGSPERLSIMMYKNQCIVSFNALLIEEVVRTIEQGEYAPFYEIRNTETTPESLAHLYINHQRIPALMAAYVEGKSSREFENYFPKGVSCLALCVDSLHYQLTGRYFPHSEEDLGLFNLEPGVHQKQNILPDLSRANLTTLNFNIKSFEPLTEHLEEKEQFEFFDREDFWEYVEGRFNYAILGNKIGQAQEKVLCFRVKNAKKMKRLLKGLKEHYQKKDLEKAEGETVSKTGIFVPEKDFPVYLLGSLFQGFENSYLLANDSLLWLSNSPQALSRMKSLQTLQLSTQGTDTALATLSFRLDLKKSWQTLTEQLSPQWQHYLSKHKLFFFRFTALSMQLNTLGEEESEVAWSLHFNPDKQPLKNIPLKVEKEVLLPVRAVSRPYLFKSHVDRSTEVLLADAYNRVLFLDKKGEVLWKYPLGGRLASEIYQIDRYNNRKWQFLLATERKIILIDRKGRVVKNFPIALEPYLETHQLSHLMTGDDNDLFMVSDLGGNACLYSQYGTLQKGWNPRRLLEPLVAPATMVPVGKYHYILTLTQNGTVNVMDRMGKSLSGFPVMLNRLVSDDYAVSIGPDKEHTSVNLLTVDGELIQVNLNGKVVERNDLYSPGSLHFALCKEEVRQREWLIAQFQAKKITLLDAQGKEVFQKSFANANPRRVQYFNFNVEYRMVAVTDEVTRQTDIYYLNGAKYNQESIPSEHDISMEFVTQKNKLLIYALHGRNLRIFSYNQDRE
ncbi:hypothetical protein AAG747_02755 [Rapidithrix thailandica]|uniref:Uncharacterized protein n=1 Tax=Rapidithrix thailandica TaxID=413964 RepID=A0AAW9RT71_9BACT